MNQNKNVTLLLPDLFDRLKGTNEVFELPQLAYALSKANVEILANAPNVTSTLSVLGELSQSSKIDLNSPAAFHLSGQGEVVDSWVCYASPVMIQPNRDHLAITQAEGFDFDESEAANLCAEFNDYFKEEGLRFSFTTPDIWLCHSEVLNTAADISAKNIIGENIIGYLPKALSDVQWRKMFNETQMLLHHSSANQSRISKGKPEINSLWFWGGGRLPESYRMSFDHVMTNNPEIKGFAVGAHVVCEDLPDHIDTNHLSDVIYVIDFEYSHNVIALFERYSEECLQLLKDKSIKTLTIVPEHGRKFTLSSNSLKKFWKRPQPISTFFS